MNILTTEEIVKRLKTHREYLCEIYGSDEIVLAIDTAIECMGETKLKQENGFMLTECCNIPTRLTDNYCPNCGKKIIK